jgi:hypothetical protein
LRRCASRSSPRSTARARASADAGADVRRPFAAAGAKFTTSFARPRSLDRGNNASAVYFRESSVAGVAMDLAAFRPRVPCRRCKRTWSRHRGRAATVLPSGDRVREDIAANLLRPVL